MVRVSLLSGPNAGEIIEAPFGLITPQDILCGVASYRYLWSTDYSDATDDERMLWESQERSMKLVRALANGATVRFLNKDYRSSGVAGAFEVAAEIEDHILESGKIAHFESDTDQLVIIGVR